MGEVAVDASPFFCSLIQKFQSIRKDTMKITKEWLREKDACPKGIVWFVNNYPDGLKITKTGINKLFSKLNNREAGFEKGCVKTNHFKKDVKYDTLRTMHWLLDCLVQDEKEFLDLDWESRITQKESLDIWWSLYTMEGNLYEET